MDILKELAEIANELDYHAYRNPELQDVIVRQANRVTSMLIRLSEDEDIVNDTTEQYEEALEEAENPVSFLVDAGFSMDYLKGLSQEEVADLAKQEGWQGGSSLF